MQKKLLVLRKQGGLGCTNPHNACQQSAQARLRQKLSLANVKNFFTGSVDKDPAAEKLDELKVRHDCVVAIIGTV